MSATLSEKPNNFVIAFKNNLAKNKTMLCPTKLGYL